MTTRRNWKTAKINTLRKAQRLWRIFTKQRPSDLLDTQNELRRMAADDQKENSYFHLHPTKGWRKRAV